MSDEQPPDPRPGLRSIDLPEAERRRQEALRLKAGRESLRRTRRAFDREQLERQIEEGTALKCFVMASRWMSRRGLRLLKNMAMSGNLGAVRILASMVTTLESIRLQEAILAQRNEPAPLPGAKPTTVKVGWCDEGDKT